jgi:hypothetical protein
MNYQATSDLHVTMIDSTVNDNSTVALLTYEFTTPTTKNYHSFIIGGRHAGQRLTHKDKATALEAHKEIADALEIN